MKKTLLFICVSMFILNNSCEMPASSVGMTSWEGVKDMKWHIGTEAPIKTVAEFEDAWRSRDYDKMKSMCTCLLYTSPSPRDRQKSRMPSSA